MAARNIKVGDAPEKDNVQEEEKEQD